MADEINDKPESAVQRVAKLRPGETYTAARFLTAAVNPDEIRTAKRELAHLLSPVIARARKLSLGDYRLHTIQSFTKDYDVIVAGVIVRGEDVADDL